MVDTSCAARVAPLAAALAHRVLSVKAEAILQ
jgi:hypothetical protein